MDNQLKEIMEDILRLAAEKEGDLIPFSLLKSETSASDELFVEAIDRLERKGLASIERDEFILTKIGREKAEKILEKHAIIEKYFKEIFEEPMRHDVAHALEHFVADKTISRMRELLMMNERGKPAPEFPIGREVLIVAIQSTDKNILEKIISLGLAPGGKVKIEERIPSAVIFNIEGRKVALANELAEKILAVIEDEEY